MISTESFPVQGKFERARMLCHCQPFLDLSEVQEFTGVKPISHVSTCHFPFSSLHFHGFHESLFMRHECMLEFRDMLS